MNVNAMLSSRRAFVKWAAALPMLSAFAVEDLFAKARKSTVSAGPPRAPSIYA